MRLTAAFVIWVGPLKFWEGVAEGGRPDQEAWMSDFESDTSVSPDHSDSEAVAATPRERSYEYYKQNMQEPLWVVGNQVSRLNLAQVSHHRRNVNFCGIVPFLAYQHPRLGAMSSQLPYICDEVVAPMWLRLPFLLWCVSFTAWQRGAGSDMQSLCNNRACMNA